MEAIYCRSKTRPKKEQRMGSDSETIKEAESQLLRSRENPGVTSTAKPSQDKLSLVKSLFARE